MEPSNSIQLFIYSSLRTGFHRKSYHYIAQYFTFLCSAKVRGSLSVCEGHAIATPSNDYYIMGELYKLTNTKDFAWVFAQLDDYEGLTADPGEIPLYRRELTTVHKDDNTVTAAWIYWSTQNPGFLIPSGDVMEFLESRNL
ncbi:MAG: gamma-glutamylcyclotransferase family protein [Ginsengibacter sp.]